MIYTELLSSAGDHRKAEWKDMTPNPGGIDKAAFCPQCRYDVFNLLLPAADLMACRNRFLRMSAERAQS
jgi:hypothetical protein